MDPREIVGAFERFKQTNNNGNISGHGIGLSLTKDLTDLLNGRIYARSQLEKGTEIILFFPVNQEAFQSSAEIGTANDCIDNFRTNDYTPLLSKNQYKPYQSANNSIEPKIKDPENPPRKILIVDDNPDLLEYISSILHEDYELFFARNGEEGFKKCKSTDFHLIITDVMMPVMDGMQFCSKIKGDPDTCHVPVILLTARKGTDSEIKGLETGADDYISKPFNPEVLKQRVKNSIENRKKLWSKVNTVDRIIPEGLHLTKKDSIFLEKVIEFVEKNISDAELNQDKICSELSISRTQLYRKLNSLTDQSVNEFIRNIRLKRAAEILRCGNNVHIAELAYTVGFSEHSYFSKMFRNYFGITPKAYNKQHAKDTTP
jgi:DNA-binding response OmpR family regulator